MHTDFAKLMADGATKKLYRNTHKISPRKELLQAPDYEMLRKQSDTAKKGVSEIESSSEVRTEQEHYVDFQNEFELNDEFSEKMAVIN